MTSPVDVLLDLLHAKGTGWYGDEAVSESEHARQAAVLARAARASPALVAAALLHDVGHLLHHLGERAAREGVDDRHEVAGADYLGRWFGPDVTEPVRLHVDAKRYLCAVDPGYLGRLSPASVRSLALQGGPLTRDEALAFGSLSGAQAAVRLRRWDDEAKVVGLVVPKLDAFRPALLASLRPGG